MSIFMIISIGIGLAMDAFAVAICQGLKMPKVEKKNGIIIALFFGIFQGMMPMIGYYLGKQFEGYIISIDHWIIFILLLMIGINMIKESFKDDEIDKSEFKLDFKELSMMAIATSIDAFSIGITFAFLKVNIFLSSCIIAIETFCLSLIAVLLGHKLGLRFKNKAELFGGLVLIIIGIKILLEHLGIL